MARKRAVLVVLDGWGVAPASEGNAIAQAHTPVMDDLVRRFPAMTLRASGEEVGLSWGEMGNSEVGHLTIGAGRVYYQMLPRIDRDIASGAFFERPALLQAIAQVKANGSKLHLVGLMSSGRVHGMDTHCHALLDLAKRHGLTQVFVHAILDGRDTLYNAGADFIGTLEQKMEALQVGKLASMVGRFYAMDRDNRWDRIEKAYNLFVKGVGEVETQNPLEALRSSYGEEVYDEQMPPTVVTQGGAPITTIGPHDVVIFFNFRPDRARELTRAFALPDFEKFSRSHVEDLLVVTMAEYEAGLPVDVVYPAEVIRDTLGEVISKAGLKQLHIAETEKYAHVTFFLNGTEEKPFAQEERVIIPSPKVASYDAEPAMSAPLITDRVIRELRSGDSDFIVLNFANPDMVGHTGNLDATIKACEVVDLCIGRIVETAMEKESVVFVTADHGNAEELTNLQTKDMDKEHSTNPVPFLVIAKSFEGQPGPMGEVPNGDLSLSPPVGMLADVAPTILKMMDLPQPGAMTGTSLV